MSNTSIKETCMQLKGKIIDSLQGAKFKVLLTEESSNNHEIMAYVSGKMRKNRIHILTGDEVIVEITPYDLTKGRIIKRIININKKASDEIKEQPKDI